MKIAKWPSKPQSCWLEGFLLCFVQKMRSDVTFNCCIRLPFRVLDLRNLSTPFLTKMSCNCKLFWRILYIRHKILPELRFKTCYVISEISWTMCSKTTVLLLQLFSPFKQSKACWASSKVKLFLVLVGAETNTSLLSRDACTCHVSWHF